MKTKKLLNVICILSILILTSCSIHKKPESYNIDGNVYKTGFYDFLSTNSQAICFNGDLYGKSDDVWNEEKLSIGNTTGYKISYAEFDLYSIKFGMWKYDLYVLESQFDLAREFYSSYKNYHYYWALGQATDYDVIYEVEASEELGNMLKELNGVNKFNQKEYAEINSESKAYFFYKISDDGLLTSSREQYYIVDNKLILFTMLNDEKVYGVEIEEELSIYFIDLINMN